MYYVFFFCVVLRWFYHGVIMALLWVYDCCLMVYDGFSVQTAWEADLFFCMMVNDGLCEMNGLSHVCH